DGQAGEGALPAWPAAICGLLAALGVTGSPPLAGARGDATAAPAPLSALIYGLAAPAAGLGWLLRSVAALPIVPTNWAVALGLTGAIGALACGAGALGVRGLRQILAWVTAGMSAAVVASAGLAGPLAAVAGPGLLVALMLAATLGATAAAGLERTTGSDDYTEGGGTPPRAAGAVWALAAAAALGLPPLWGFWPRLWLLQAAQEQQPWLLTPLLAGGVLTALALLAPLGRLWGATGAARATGAGWADLAPGALAGLPLVALGLAPGLAWAGWLAGAPFAPAELPATPAAQAAAAAAGLALAALTTAALLARPARAPRRDPDEEEVRLAPDALGAALRPLAWLADPEPLLGLAWRGLQRASEGLRFVIGLFEQRYYLLGVLAALLTIMLLMAQ
ncbi:MAG TPA: proton-conducting transporter membrane subunit, partial [Chloroflexaceae bacterium]|nr:proton-conducting transporter membrane subunit [Chloroflexaceae bacterium]